MTDESVIEDLIGNEVSEETMDINDSDWEDLDDNPDTPQRKKTIRTPLTRFVRELDRYKTSYRAGAAIGNALLKDYRKVLNIPKDDLSKYFVDSSRLRREKEKEGKKAKLKHREGESSIRALYFDGKKTPAVTEVIHSI